MPRISPGPRENETSCTRLPDNPVTATVGVGVAALVTDLASVTASALPSMRRAISSSLSSAVTRPAPTSPTVAQDRQAVGDLHDLGQVVADQHCRAAVGSDAPQHRVDAPQVVTGKCAGRLVEDDEPLAVS